MEAALATQVLRQIFPQHDIENCNLSQLTSRFPLHLPYIPMSELRLHCRNQEKKALDSVLQVKDMDLYDEMNQVCPNNDLKIIRSMSNEEVNEKIHEYSSQAALTELKQGKEGSEKNDDSMMDTESEVYMQDEKRYDSHTGLRNIFEECDHHFSWNELNVYDLH